MGEVRLQWWRDVVEKTMAGEVSHGPVADALADTISHFGLPRVLFQELIDARTFDLYNDPMATLTQFEIYLDSTSGSLIRLAAQIVGGRETQEINETATHAGRAYGITGLLRSFAHHAFRGQVYLPLEVLARHGATRDEVISGRSREGVKRALREMRDLARFHMMEAQRRMVSLPKNVLPAFMPVEMIPSYLTRMERPGYDPFVTPIQLPQLLRPWTIWRAAKRLGSRR